MKFVGRKQVMFDADGSKGKLEFHVTNTTKPLASAMAVVKAGNRVVLEDAGGYIENRASGRRIELHEKGGTYVFDIVPEKRNMRYGKTSEKVEPVPMDVAK